MLKITKLLDFSNFLQTHSKQTAFFCVFNMSFWYFSYDPGHVKTTLILKFGIFDSFFIHIVVNQAKM